MAPTVFDREINVQIERLASRLKRGEIHFAFDIAIDTVDVLLRVVGNTKWSSAKELMDSIRAVGKRLIDAQPSESVIGNMVRRVLKIIREEYATADQPCVATGKEREAGSGESLQNFLLADNKSTEDFTTPATKNFRSDIIDAIKDLSNELELSTTNIASQALEHIHSNEIIMTVGKSRTVEKFLKNAARKRNFSVIIAECAPFYKGQELAKSLAEDKIEATVITDSAVFAMMARVNKVIIGADTVMADGGLKAGIGSHCVALAAKYHSVPLLVCAGLFELSPQYVCSYDQDNINKFLSPNDVMLFAEGEILSKITIHNPAFDYVPPDLVSLFLSDIGGNSPTYMYRLLSEMYHPDDYTL